MSKERPFSTQPSGEEQVYSVKRHECPQCGQFCRKPLIRVVCPVCAKVVTVNAVDREGTAESPCSQCPDSTIAVQTDETGCIRDISGWANSQEKPKMDWRLVLVSMLIGVFLALIVFSLARASGNKAGADPAATQPISSRAAEAELASPTKAGSVTDGDTEPATQKEGKSIARPDANPAPTLTPDLFASPEN